jgi:hypothetical protein
MAAFRPASQDAVEGYEWFYGPEQYVAPTSSPNPWWYHGSGAAAWNQTVWAPVYINTPPSTIFNPR